MRDPNRIAEIQALIETIWKRNPDMRYMQLLYILQSGFSEKNSGKGKVIVTEKDGYERIGYDMFNVEDDEFKAYLVGMVENA